LKRIHFLPQAGVEVERETRYYRREAGPGVAGRFVRAIEQATRVAMEFPDAGSAGPEDTRRLQVQGFPYSLFYRPIEDGVLVLAVAHHAREPNYWQSRQ
jgi:toxin ParE1/3/4